MKNAFENYIGYERVDESYKYDYSKERYLDAIASLFHLQAPVTACIKQGSNLYISYNKSPLPIHYTRKECIKNFLCNLNEYSRDSLLLMYLIFNEDFAFAASNSSSDLDLFIKQCSKDNDKSDLTLLSKDLKQLSKICRNKVDKLLFNIPKFAEHTKLHTNTIVQDIINDIFTKDKSLKSQEIKNLLQDWESKILNEKTLLEKNLETLITNINLYRQNKDYKLAEKLNTELKKHSDNIKLNDLLSKEKQFKDISESIADIEKGECSQVVTIYKSIINNLNIYKPEMEKYNLESILRPMQDCYKLYLKYNNNGIDILNINILDNDNNLHADTNIAVTMRLFDKEKNYIGVSKLTCGYCHEELKDYPHRGTHGVCDDGWNYYFPTQKSMDLEEFSQDIIKKKKVPKIKNFELVNQRKDLSFDNSYDNEISKFDTNYQTLLDLKNKYLVKKQNFYSNLAKNFSKLNLYSDKTLNGIDSKEISIKYIDSYFGKYTLDAIDTILQLRLFDTDQSSNIDILQASFLDKNKNNITDIIEGIFYSDKNIILVPINLFNKHAVGLIFERNEDNSYQIKYIDPMNNPIPSELLEVIQNILSDSQYEQIEVEQQKYANCGPEIIENFIFYLTGTRVSQEKAIELHSKLVENHLLNANQPSLHLLFEEFVTSGIPNVKNPVGEYSYSNDLHVEHLGDVPIVEELVA